jgi:hypothetical protein
MAMGDTSALKAKFRQLDKNGDNCLSLAELTDLLRAGNPNMKMRAIKTLYASCDTNGDGVIQFDEFVDFIHSAAPPTGSTSRTTAGRHATAVAAATSHDEGDGAKWADVQACFESFAGKDKCLQGVEFAKFCKQSHLFNTTFTKHDVDLVFAKVVPRGLRAMQFDEFRCALMQVALKRECRTSEVQDIVIAAGGATFEGTKADAVRLHDDKTTYTGSHTANPHHGDACGVEKKLSENRHAALVQRAAEQSAQQDVEGDWSEVKLFFDEFAKDARCSSVDLCKMLVDTGCIKSNGKLTKTDVELVFSSKAPAGAKFIDFETFKDCLRVVACKLGTSVAELQDKIVHSEGAIYRGTQGASRFHDDKSTYTGMHYGK